MDADNNETKNDSDLQNSIRFKYKGRRKGKKINSEIVKTRKEEDISQLEDKPIIKEEIIIIKEEPNANKTLATSPDDIPPKIITTKIMVQDDEEGKPKQEVTTTNNEIEETDEPNNIPKKVSSQNEERVVNSSQKDAEINTIRNKYTNNIIYQSVRSKGRQIKEVSPIKQTINTTVINQENKTNSKEKKENEIIKTGKENIRGNRDGKEEIVIQTINTRLNKRTGSDSQGKSDQKGKITSIKTVTTNLSTTNGRQSGRGKNQNQSQEKQEINLIEGLNNKDVKGLRKEKMEQINSNPGQNGLKQSQNQKKIEIKIIQRQNDKDIKGSKKEVIVKSNSNQKQNVRNQNQSQENVEINLTEGLSNKDIKGLRKEMIDQFYSYPEKNSRYHSQEKSQNQKIKLKNELNTIQIINSRRKSEEPKLKPKKEIYISQRINSRRESQNSKNQVKQNILTNSVNRRSSGNTSTITSNKTVTKVILKQNYVSNRESKTKIIAQTGSSKANSNQINVKEIDHNKRSSANRNTSSNNSNKKANEKPENAKKPERNIIQVQKVLVTDTANLQKKIYNQKPTSNNISSNNYNTNTYFNKNANKNIATKLAINQIKTTEQKVYSSTMTDFYKNKDNISSITINDTGKIPKKQYVLHVRKLDRIRSKSRMRIAYINDMEEKGPVKSGFNHKMLVTKNVTREFRTINDIKDGEKVSHRYSYSNLSSISNIGRKEIKENIKSPKKQVIVSMRKNEVIKSARKPFKLNYKNYSERDTPEKKQIIIKKDEIKSILKNKNNVIINQEQEQRRERRNNNSRSSRNSRDSRNSGQSSSQKILKTNINNNKTIVSEAKIKTRRIISDLNMEKIEGKDNNKTVIITKTVISSGKEGEKNNNSRINNKINVSEVRKSSTNKRDNKNEIAKSQIITPEKRSNRNKASGNDVSHSKIISMKNIIIKKNGNKDHHQVHNSREQSKEKEEIDLIEGLSSKDAKGLRKKMINQFYSYSGQESLKQIQIQGKEQTNLIQGQNSKYIKDLKKESIDKSKLHQGQNSRNQSKEKEEINLIEGLSSKDAKGLRKEMMEQFYSYTGQNGIYQSQRKRKEEIGHIQEQNGKDIKSLRKEIIVKSNSNQRHNVHISNQSREKKEINLIEGLNSKDIRGLREEMMEQFYSYPDNNLERKENTVIVTTNKTMRKTISENEFKQYKREEKK